MKSTKNPDKKQYYMRTNNSKTSTICKINIKTTLDHEDWVETHTYEDIQIWSWLLWRACCTAGMSCMPQSSLSSFSSPDSTSPQYSLLSLFNASQPSSKAFTHVPIWCMLAPLRNTWNLRPFPCIYLHSTKHKFYNNHTENYTKNTGLLIVL